jgi:type VI secretion system protein ImpL
MQFLQGLMGGGQMSLMGLIVFVLITYFSGQYSAFMYKWRAPMIIAGAVIFFIVLIIQKMIAKKSAAAIEDRLQAQAQEQMASARPDRKPAVQALQKQLTEAIASLKTSKMGAGALYSLPWYIIIGPPGSGKSTALQESGLNFPYMSQGRKGIRGVGGTRNCDWWFTDQGILLDTAGRYTTELEDRDEWLSFLDMLKRCRKRKPINGAIVCVSVADLVQCTDEEREGHVKNIKDRIDELTKRLEQVFPVYLLFTKCDLLNGFTDFFEDFGKGDRAQVWGFTLPYGGPKIESYQPIFDEEVKKLYAQLSAQRVTALAGERPMDKKRRIFGFPLQFSMAHRKLADFVGELFRPNPFQESSLLRGVYFTSGTQEGTPIDQLVSAMGGAFGLQEDTAGLLSQAVDRKSYFINTLFSKVIFGDQNLARSSTKVARRRRFMRAGMVAASGLALVGFSLSLIIAFFGNLGLMKSVGGTAAKVQEAGKSSSGDLAENLRALEALRVRIDELDKYTSDNLPMSLRWGLYRGKQVYLGEDGKTGIRKVYIDAINRLFVRNLGQTLAGEMNQLLGVKKGDKEFNQLFEVLQVYLMIGKPLDPAKPVKRERELIDSVLKDNDRWLKTLGPTAPGLPDDAKKIADAQRIFYIDQLVKGATWEYMTLPEIDVDGKLVKDVVGDLQGGLWITESFQNIIAQAGDRFKGVNVDTVLGNLPGKELFECKAEYHIQGAYTSEALNRYVRSAIKEKSDSLSGKFAKLGVTKTPESIVATLTEMYESEYLRQWDRFFKNIELKNFDNLKDASNKLKLLTASKEKADANPFQKLCKEVWEGRAVVGPGKTSDDRSWLNESLTALEELQRALNKLLNTSPDGDRFVNMQTQSLKELSFLLDNCKGKIDSATKKADPALADTAAKVLTQSLMSTLSAFGSEAQAEAETYWKKNVYDFYAAKLAGRYPLAAGATEEIPLKTFSEFFNPKSGSLWKAIDRLNTLRDGFKFEGRSLVKFSTEYEDCEKKSRLYAGALYPNEKSELIELPLTLTFGLRTAVAEVILFIGDKRFSSNDDPTMTVNVIWSEAGTKGAKVEIKHDVTGSDALRTSNEKYGSHEWGLLRLFADAIAKSEKKYEVTWKFEAMRAGEKVQRLADCWLEVQKAETPFAPKFFAEFKVPERMAQ